jgi:hypothetical protein
MLTILRSRNVSIPRVRRKTASCGILTVMLASADSSKPNGTRFTELRNPDMTKLLYCCGMYFATLVCIFLNLSATLASQSAAPRNADKQHLQQQAQGLHRLENNAATAEILLAKDGDRRQMQRIACELWYSKDARTQMEATIKLGQVGGYASIEELSEVMHRNPKYNVTTHAGFLASLQSYAIKQLAVLLPQVIPPVFGNFPNTATEEQMRTWYEWIQQHHDEIYTAPQEVPDVTLKACRIVLKQQRRKNH